LFPGLDLPFMGMVNEQLKPDTLLSQLQTVNFAVQELALYLDTHREDTEALELYRSYQ
jgi:spore coat protein JB